MSCVIRAFPSALLATLLIATVPPADGSTWTGTATGNETNWFAGGNWDSGGVPTASDDVTINRSAGPVITTGSAVAKVVRVGSSGTGQLILRGDSALASTGNSAIAYGGTGHVLLEGGARWDVTGGLYLAENGGDGTLDIGGVAVVKTTAFSSIARSGGGQGTVNISGSAFFDVANSLFIGDAGHGTLNMSGSARAQNIGSGDLIIGRGANYSGTVTLRDFAAYTAGRDIILGDGGSSRGELYLNDNSTVQVTRDVIIGRGAGATGTIALGGSAKLTMSANLTIGGASGITSAHGELHLSDYAFVQVGTDAYIARYSTNTNSDGIVTVQDSSTLAVGGIFRVGGYGSGTLIVKDNALYTNTQTVLGQYGNAAGVAVVSGSATWITHGLVHIGYRGNGSLTLENGGHVMAGTRITLGSETDGTGDSILRITGTTAGLITGTDGASPTVIRGGSSSGAKKVIFDHGDANYTFVSHLEGTLAVEHSGAGYTLLTGSNNYTGGTVINGGTLAGSTASLQGPITTNAVALLAETAGVTGTYAGAVDGAGVLAIGGGTVELAGDFSAFDGTVAVREGTLLLAGAAAASVKKITLSAAATYDGGWTAGADRLLAGSGTVTGNVSLDNGAILRAGGDTASPGTLTIGGDLVINNSTLRFGLFDNNISDSINILGTLTATGINTIDISTMISGSYTLGNIAGLAGARLVIGGEEQVAGGRQSATLLEDPATPGNLVLIFNADISTLLRWTGSSTALINISDDNWTNGGSITKFAPGDTVIFDGAADAANPGRRAITLGAGALKVSDMRVEGAADYTFTGSGGITADASFVVTENGNANNLVNAEGKLLKTGAGTLAFENTGTNSFAGGIEIAGGAIVFNSPAQLGGATPNAITFTATGTLAAGADGLSLANEITIAPNAAATLDTRGHALAYAGASGASSSGTLTKRGTGTLSVTGTLRAANIVLAQGDLALAPGAQILAVTEVVVRPDTTWSGEGVVITPRFVNQGLFDARASGGEIRGTFVNQGVLKIGKAAGAASHGTLRIDGDYTGDGGTIGLDMTLNAAGTAVTHDKLLVTGNVSGSTAISFQSAPAAERLKGGVDALPALPAWLDAAGTLDPGAFTQAGTVEFGGRAYFMDFSTGKWIAGLAPAVPAIVCVDAAAILIGKASFASLSNRLVQARATNTARGMELWVGGLSRREKLGGSLYDGAKADTQGVQAGIDWAKPLGDGGFSFGLYFDYAKSDMHLGDRAASTDTEATAGGLYASWTLGKWYLDMMLRRANEHYDVAPRNTAPFSMKGDSWGGSIETGIALPLGRAWRLEPQAQLIYQTHDIDKAKDTIGRTYEIDSADSLDGRVGVKLWRDMPWRNGMRKFTPYIRASWLYEFKGASIVHVGDEEPFRNDLGGSTGMIDLGIALELGRGFAINAKGSWFFGGMTTGHSIDAGLGYAW
ncbi:hypothetical protein AW736_13170 [Termitidicoccus mucosus]|uniref:Autotransporter domain-containing protein n=1 Tax=Termitidicoccus mucosus TaxID=1184151 RepID=A0A178IHE9_9BACT|nr:hypothetical protein AW736_13170 [Opitutaceae bacterium TSB47]